jgi:hypothetical protein
MVRSRTKPGWFAECSALHNIGPLLFRVCKQLRSLISRWGSCSRCWTSSSGGHVTVSSIINQSLIDSIHLFKWLFIVSGWDKGLGGRVTRLGEFSPIGWMFTLGYFFSKIAQWTQKFFSIVKCRYICMNQDKNWVCLHFGRFCHKHIWSPCWPAVW